MSSSPPIHVVPHPRGSWRVHREGHEHPLSEHDSETDAESAAIERAAATGAGEVIVHDRYGRVHTARRRSSP
jgi:hypothetical protein